MTMLNLELENIIAPALAVLGFELVCYKFVSEAGRKTLRIYIDSPKGLTVDDCMNASRQVSAILDVQANIDFPYDLEVSSPGLDRPLITLAHFQRFIGSIVKIKLHTPMGDRRHFTGQLISATAQVIQLLVDKETVDISFENIEKANLVPGF